MKPFAIVRHRLADVPFTASPNTDGATIRPEAMVVHYTAGGEGAARWLADSRAGVSAHLTISRTGEVTQLVPFTTKAWHAGRSEWQGRPHLNAWSIGIELENWGWLTPDPRDEMAMITHTGARIPFAHAIGGTHRNGGPWRWWERYPGAQVNVLVWVARAICREYGIKTILGHDDVSPGRKSDPGPAFPMACFRPAVLGR